MNTNIREKIYKTVHIYEGNKACVSYKYFMVCVILVSLVPLMFKERFDFFVIPEICCLIVFVIDFLLRWVTADYKFGKSGIRAFIKYPFRLMSIIDILSIFAMLCSLFSWLAAAKVLVVFRIVRILRYSKSVRLIVDILRRSKNRLIAVGSLAVGYIIISAIVVFNVEPASFSSFFDAVYWSTVTLTTVGYGDIYPTTALGQSVAMISSVFGIAIIALPAGIVTADYLNSLKENTESDKHEM